MNIFNKGFNFPKKYTGKVVIIFPTNIEFAASDYDAVIASRNELHLWSSSSWPEDDFSIEINREDLKNHVEDNEEHCAYGFMLYDSSKEKCFGSLYINPLDPENFKNDKKEIKKFDARIDCWIRTDIQESLKVKIIKDLIDWFSSEWSICYGFTARLSLPQYENMFRESGLERALTLVYKDGNELYLYSR